MIAFASLVIISGIVATLIFTVFAPKDDDNQITPAPTIPPKEEPPTYEHTLKHIIHSNNNDNCIKGNSISMSSDGNRVAYINSNLNQILSLDYDNQQFINVTIEIYDYTKNQTILVNSMNNSEMLLSNTLPICLSRDGEAVAYASFNAAGPNLTTIQVQKDNHIGAWNKIGNSIQYLRHPDSLSLSLSKKADFIAIGNPKDIANGLNSGRATLYQYFDAPGYNRPNKYGQWKIINNSTDPSDGEIVGQNGDMAGSSVSLSTSGLIFATGLPYSMHSDGQTGSFIVNTYTAINDKKEYTVKQNTQHGTNKDSLFGTSISLSNNGRRIAVGASQYSFNNDNNGKCEVFYFNTTSNQWTKVGNTLIGTNTNSYFGYQVSLSGNGKRVAISSKNPYIVQVYEYFGDNWGMISTNFTYPHNNDVDNDSNTTTTTTYFGSSISLNEDGSVLAISSSQEEKFYNNNTVKCGQVFLYDISIVNENPTDA